MKCSPEQSEPPVSTDLRSLLNLCGAADAPFGIESRAFLSVLVFL
jgi:hypothetical protein